ncbi:MAG: hypothetical protein CME65_04900 [Halobacteriovoraceae bacterium]|nr:hypothetical protein [Halobacteriovoraceae bacterium]|tara:strand:+ start:12042 stop:13541 length:1500 start_codon:yes stop_codon:yes gene_type:complete
MKYWKFGVLAVVLVAGFIFFSQSGNYHVDSKNGKIHQKFNPSKANRSTASDNDLIQSINDRIIAIKNRAEIKPLIEEIIRLSEQDSHRDNQTLKLYRAIIEPMKHMESLIWRLREVVEKSGLMHMQALSMIRKAYYKDYMYGPHILAILDYLTMPSDTLLQFNRPEDIQEFANGELKSSLENSLNLVQEVIANTDSDWSFSFDAYLASGYDPENNKVFISEAKRFEKRVNHQYLYFIESNLHRVIGAIEFAVNYDINDYPRFVNQMVSKTAVNTLKKRLFLRSLPKPITPLEMIEAANDYRNFLTLRKSKEEAQANLSSSMEHFYQARVKELVGFQKSIDETDHNNTDQYFLNPNILKIGREDKENNLKDKISLFEAAKAGSAKTITSEITGQQIQIDMRALFTPHENLRSFFPTPSGINQAGGKGGNLEDENGDRIRHKITGQTLFGWNYRYGKPLSFPDPTFGGFLPGASNENIYDIARTMELTGSLDHLKELIPLP